MCRRKRIGRLLPYRSGSNKEHVIATESEFSPNTLSLFTEAGRNYYVRQYIKPGAFVGGADLELIPEEQGKTAVSKLELATPGTYSDPTPITKE